MNLRVVMPNLVGQSQCRSQASWVDLRCCETCFGSGQAQTEFHFATANQGLGFFSAEALGPAKVVRHARQKFKKAAVDAFDFNR